MKKNSEHVQQLYTVLINELLPALARGDEKAFDCLERAHVKIVEHKLPIEFSLGNLFNATWLWGKQSGLQLPDQSNYRKEFGVFWELLTNPWPIERLDEEGLQIRPVKTSGAKDLHTYVLSIT